MANRDIELDYISLEQRSSRTSYEVDELLASVYALYTYGGLTNYVIIKLCIFLTEVLLYGVLFLLCFCVDWSAVLAVNSIITVSFNVLFRVPTGTLFIVYTVVASLVLICRAILAIGEYLFLRCINAELLSHSIDLSQPSFRRWKTVAERLIALIGGSVSSEEESRDNDLEIRVRLLRRENYKVAILTDASLELPPYTKPVEWILDYAVWDYIFHPSSGMLKYPDMNEYNINQHSNALKQRLKICGIIYCILSPFIFIYYLFYSILAYAQQLRISPTLVVDRTWSSEALLYYRNYNELPHEFLERMAQAADYTSTFMASKSNKLHEALVRFSLFAVTSFSMCLFIFSLLNGNVLTNVLFHDGANLLAVLGILAIAIGSLQSMLPKPSEIGREEENWKKVQSLLQLPDHAFCDIEQSKILLYDHFIPRWKYWIAEIVSILTAPYICVTLYSQTEKIFRYISTHTVKNSKVGTACSKSIWECEILTSVSLDGALTNKKLATSIMMYVSKQ